MRKANLFHALFCAILFVSPTGATTPAAPAASDDPQSTNLKRDCSTPPYHQLDFKIGHYSVSTVKGQYAGESRVEQILGGCALVEQWRNAVGRAGQAVFVYEASTERWQILYVNDEGQMFAFTGRDIAGEIVFEGESRFYGMIGLHRLKWSPLSQGGVRQDWHVSKDGGETWERIFDGRYSPVR